MFRRLQESCIRVSDVVITICPALESYVNTVQDEPQKNILIENSIFDAVHLAEPDAAESGPERQSLNPALPANRRVVFYAGTLESYQGIELLLKAFCDTISSCSDVFLLIAGGTDRQVQHYTAMAHTLGMAKQVLLLGNLPHKQTASYLERAAVLVSPRIEGTNTPLKIYQQIASGIPLVATDIKSHRQVLDDTVAFLAPPDPRSLAHALVCALTCPEDATDRASKAQRLYSSKYSRASYTEKVRQVLAMVL
jgi:glycosyltransferase involved in cell wall biosynthesis